MSDDPKKELGKVSKVRMAKTLKKAVDKMVLKDPKFKGLAKYMANVSFFWTYEIETACAGHGFIFFNPDFYKSIPKQTRKTVIAHEVWHLILKHVERGEKFEPKYYNIAADHVINLSLEEQGFTFKGTKPYKDKKYTYMSTEQIYAKIFTKKPKDRAKIKKSDTSVSPEKIGELVEDALENFAKDLKAQADELAKQKGQAPDEDDEDEDGNKKTKVPKTIDQQKKDNDELVNRTCQKGSGNLGGSVGISLDLSRTRVVIENASYMEIFEKYLIDPLSGGKRSFMRPNRRQSGLHRNLVLPGRTKRRGKDNRLTHLVYALDVSGSINQHQAQQFHDSVRTIKEMLNPKKLTVMFFDTRVVHEQVFTDMEAYKAIRVNAGGGTDLRDVYKKVGKIQPEALVIFTDLQVSIPLEPSWDTIWLLPYYTSHVPSNLYGDVYLIPEP